MAYIPYGYGIKDGDIFIDPEKQKKLIRFFEKYVAGATVKSASSELSMSVSTCTRLLDNCTYLGTADYPQMISEELFEQVQKMREKRRREAPRTGHGRKVLPVYTDFCWNAECSVAADAVMQDAVSATANTVTSDIASDQIDAITIDDASSQADPVTPDAVLVPQDEAIRIEIQRLYDCITPVTAKTNAEIRVNSDLQTA